MTKLLIALIPLFVPLAAVAQIAAGSIGGFVFDPDGRPVARVYVTASDASRGETRKVLSNNDGYYIIPALRPSEFMITAEAGQNLTADAHEVTVPVSGFVRFDVHLSLAQRADSVTVETSAPGLETGSGATGVVLDQRTIDSLPLNRRDFLQLAMLTPGSAPPVEDSELSARGSFAMHVNGAREEFNNFLLDGADNNDPYIGRHVLQPQVDAIQEFRIASGSYQADYGRSAGGQVNVVTRAGSNEVHGFAYEYLRNRALDEPNAFDGDTKAKLIRNQFGFGAGGPIRRNRTFLFAAMDFLQSRQGTSRISSVPTAAFRQGDLSSLTTPVMDPFTRAPFPGNIIPATRISPIGQRVLALFPAPNLPGAANNHLAQPVQKEDQLQATIRGDHNLSTRDQLMVRYSLGRVQMFDPYTDDIPAIPGFGEYANDYGHSSAVRHQRTIGATTVHSLQLGFTRFARELLPENYRVNAGAALGVNWLNVKERDYGFPVLNIAGFSRAGDTMSLPILRATNNYQLTEVISSMRGRHWLRAGFEARQYRLNGVLDMLARGSLSFSGAVSGSGISDVLLGYPGFALRVQADNPLTMRTTAWNGFLQDDWKLSHTLTLNLGARYEYNSPPTDPTDRMSTLLPGTGTVVRVGTNGTSRSGIRPDRNNIAPRLGFAWMAAHDTVVRGGYGLFYDSGAFVVNTSQYFNPPQFVMRAFFPSAAGLLTLDDPFPSTRGMSPPASISTLSPDLVTPYLQHWNLTLQRQVAVLGTLSVAYVGSRGVHLIRSRDVNQPTPAPGDVQARRPAPNLANVLLAESSANSQFHSMQVSFNRPLTRGLSLLGGWTWGKSLDDSSAFLDTRPDKNFPQDSRNVRAEWAVSSFDIRQRATLAWNWVLPRQHMLTRNTEIRGIGVVQSGQPFTPLLRFDNSNTGNTGGTFGSDRPDVLRNPALEDRTAERWFDTGAFRVPVRYTFGSAGRNILRGPAYATFDLAASRRFALTEKASLYFEAQAFNLFNRTNYDLPEMFADEAASFGRIQSARAARQIQFALRFRF